ncbi:Transposase IS200 like protein [Rubripirellula reticaptiva]|uniref:Transposase IS200 like protein n=2 Tax=Rubripirellula reticaptiva TaxID=2528013 RepID=A0A5C6EC66_9BACT|nr:Transposase IS200 like protein [Rubripirellula reticaptiva]
MPGDDRGWTKWHKGEQIAQPLLADWCREQLVETAVTLDQSQRDIVEGVIYKHCEIRSWILHAVSCRTNHCHVVVSAPNYAGDQVRDQLKSYGKRKLKDDAHKRQLKDATTREHWWTRKGSVRHINDEDSLTAAIQYVLEAQDLGGSKAFHD